MVYLVGAGPGDPGLVTVRAMELIQTADVILYDRLIDPVLLCDARPDCLLIDVGKSAGDHSVPQNETTELLVRHGSSGRMVVRLKGGDPFLFGRGGEEAEELARNSIPFAVVPGVSALLAATASAGIPLTHRDLASSVAAATGHAADGKDADPVRWRELARAADTIVVFMGVGNIAAITGELMAGGMTGDMPAALIERGSTPRQRVVTSTLASIAETAQAEKVRPPALLVVGRTVPLTNTLGWFQSGPLGGLRIVVTRPLAQSKSFAERLRAIGATPVLMPAISTADTIETPEVHEAMDKLREYDYIVFSSTNGAGAFFRALYAHGLDSRALAGARIACIGPVTADALEPYGIRADITAERFVAEGLAETLTAGEPVAGKAFLLVGSNIGRTVLRDELTAAGARADQVSFYTTDTAQLTSYSLTMLKRGDIDIVTFTSSSTVRGFFGQIKPAELPEGTRFASIGPETTKELRSCGVEPDIEAAVYTTEGLAEAILERYGQVNNR